MVSVTRRYHFSASHRLHSPSLSDTENAALFGKCNNPFGHGHNYILSVTVTGEIDERTGLLVSVRKLDALLHDKVLNQFSHCNLNTDVADFTDLIPTTENIAAVIAGRLQKFWAQYLNGRRVHLQRVHILETKKNGFEIVMRAAAATKECEQEGVSIHA